jgi:hypothetical protein
MTTEATPAPPQMLLLSQPGTRTALASYMSYSMIDMLVALQVLTEKNKMTADSYQEFPMEFQEEGKRHPLRYLCAPSSHCMCMCSSRMLTCRCLQLAGGTQKLLQL